MSKVLIASLVILAFVVGYLVYPVANPKKSSVPAADQSYESIRNKGYIVVATSPDWPPFEFIDPNTNEIVGYEVDLINAVAQKLGVKVQWKQMDFDAIISAVKNNEVDLGVSGFSVTPERMKVVLYTIPHTVTQVQLITTKSKAEQLGITKLSSLSDTAKYNMVVGTESGTTEEAELLDLVNKGIIKPGQVKSYKDFGMALEDLKRGLLDAVYSETPITTWWISTEKTPLTVIYTRSYWPVAFIANKASSALVEKINAALAELFAEGKIDQIKKKWNITAGI
ncbi:MAG: transporter substrate-binding domain-containing protein [Candidatus Methanodesulfokora sp.]|jgi:ABC-type amino acid transport substrate-binding protein|nr:MAG: hypothetical protein C0200_06305 [Candidatus Korarchaeota archaeon]